MGRFCSTRFTFAALTLILAAGMHATNPAHAQNINDLLTIFGGGRPQATRQAAQAEWRRLPPAEIACIDQRLRRKGSSVEALVRRGVKPSAGRLIELRSSCRQFVESVQTDTAPALARDATGSSTSTIPASNPTEPKDAGATLLSSAEPVGPVAEEQVQQDNVELKDSLPESGMAWSSATFFVAVIAIAALLGIVVYLFIRWRNTGQRTVAVSAVTHHVSEKNSEGGAGKAPSETTIGKASEVVMPISFALADKMIQPDENGQSATISMSQNSGCSSETESTNEEILPDTVLSESSPDSSVVAKVAQLAKLCAMGTPSEKEFQRIKGLISQSLGDSQEPKLT
jgi:hypothetical protein